MRPVRLSLHNLCDTTMFCASALSLWMNLGFYTMSGMANSNVPLDIAEQFKGLSLGLFWSVYNLLMLSISLLILIDAPRPSQNEWFQLRRTVRIQIGQRELWRITTVISEEGTEIVLTQKDFPDQLDSLLNQIELMEENLCIQAYITAIDRESEFPTLRGHCQLNPSVE